jgi:protease-4
MKKLVVGALAVVGTLTILGMIGLVGLTLITTSAKPSVPTGAVLKLDIGGEYVETTPNDLMASFVLEDAKIYRNTIDAIIRARDDDKVEGIFARISTSNLGYAKTQELRDAIKSFREEGKWAWAYYETVGEWNNAGTSYYLGTAFDSIYLAPPGDVNVVGGLIATPFIRGTLDKLGIYPDMDHIGDYKSAMNTYTEKKYTAPHKEMMTWLLEDIAGQVVEGVAEGRGMTVEQVALIFDNGPYIASEALEAGLVDELLYRDEVDQRIEDKVGKKKLISEKRYLKAAGRPHSTGKNRVALIYGEGNVVRGKSGYSPLSGDIWMGSTTVTKAFRKAADNDKIKAIIFRLDCPGGSYVASDLIWREVARAVEKKPVIVSMSDVAGSGGYFVALPASKILTEPASITTSIGVLSGKMNMRGFYDKIGISFDMVKRGKNATMYSELQNFTPTERERFQNFLNRIYMDFSTKVADARDMEWEEVDAVGRGRVFTGRQAVDLGLLDGLGGMEEAIATAKELAEIPEGEEIRLEIFPKAMSTMELIMAKSSSKARSSASIMREQLAILQHQIRYLEGAVRSDNVLSMPAIEE